MQHYTGAAVSASRKGEAFGIVLPILSRNRFAILLKAMARSTRHLFVQFGFPADEVGNALVSEDLLDAKGVNPWSDVLTEERFKELFGVCRHPFTGIDYVAYYRELAEAEGARCTMLFANDPRRILQHVPRVLACDIHSRSRTKRLLAAAGAEKVFGLDDVLTAPVDGSGFQPQFGLLGSNKADEEHVRLFPRDCQPVVDRIHWLLREKTGKTVEVMVYGDGAFKDPVGRITAKQAELGGTMEAKGTTPRRLTDLIGSLCDLTSGSGDKGTPVIHIKGYFDNLASV